MAWISLSFSLPGAVERVKPRILDSEADGAPKTVGRMLSHPTIAIRSIRCQVTASYNHITNIAYMI